MSNLSMKNIIYICINKIRNTKQKEYASLKEIYDEVSKYMEVENNETLQSQIRGRLQECCEQYSSFTGDSLFLTEKIRSGNWTTITNNYKYLRHKHNTFLVTNNNWYTSEEVDVIDSYYLLEDNLDIIYKVKLRHTIDKNKADIIINELEIIRKLLKDMKQIDKINDGYGTSFEVFAISTLYNIDYEECINKYIVHGDNDGKVDAIYYGEDNDIYIYQIKINDITDDVYGKMEKNYNLCLFNKAPKNASDLYKFILDKFPLINNKVVNYRSVSSNSRLSTNTKPTEIYEMFFRNKLLPCNNNNVVLSIAKPIRPTNMGIQFNVSQDNCNNFYFYIVAKDLIKYLLESLGINPNNYDKDAVDLSKYFYDNVRGYLSVNKKMAYTIEYEPENFIKYNNGVSITGEVQDLGNRINIKNPVINNGQQTITTLIRLNKNLDKIIIPVKITNENNIIVKGKISQFSNDQVKVKAIDMLSLNSYIRKIQEIIFDGSYNDEKYFLEIYSSGKKGYYECVYKLYGKYNIIDLLDFIKLYFSVIDGKNLGSWKNTPSMQIEKLEINDFFDVDLSFKVCGIIAKFEIFLGTIKNKKEKDDLKSADLAFKYLMCKEDLTEEEAFNVIDRINKKYFYNLKDEKSKLIDIYKSASIIEKLEHELSLFKKKKVTTK